MANHDSVVIQVIINQRANNPLKRMINGSIEYTISSNHYLRLSNRNREKEDCTVSKSAQCVLPGHFRFLISRGSRCACREEADTPLALELMMHSLVL